MSQTVYLVASGDLRPSANQVCWPAQNTLEQALTAALQSLGCEVKRAHPFEASKGHGFIDSQRYGMDVFASIPKDAPVIVAEAVWQYTHHVLPGLRFHRGPILTVANWSGQWPGLVGLLNLNGSLVKAGVSFSTIWSKDFTDTYFLDGIQEWLDSKHITHDLSHVRDLDIHSLPEESVTNGRELAANLLHRKAIIGVFDEGCMGMYNAIIDDELLNPVGVFKERLSQSALVARMTTVKDEESTKARQWLDDKGLHFKTGQDEHTELTDAQIHQQLKMYIASVRIAHEFGCDAIGIQYQQGLKDQVPASDLVEGLLNNTERPPVFDEKSGEELYAGKALPHFNEVDEGAALDAVITNHCWTALGLDPATTLHDLRWGEHFTSPELDEYVWVLQISGAAPASHFVDGYKGATSERQPPMYFPLGGGTLKGIGKPGEIVWSRIFVEDGALHLDIGRGSVVRLPEQEEARRWSQTTSQWPLVSTVFHGITRDSFMARHRANHVSIAYAPDAETATKALALKAAMFHSLGVHVHLCGSVGLNSTR
ncbi:fucose isomerase [Acidicapsa ligni]|uniref:fucose isomerase n=1 Tax=Acidicapsa ligni TaxID=542300 RepID=UPI0021DFAFE8|nr:fucose isomerase [Acidicapsa ligni]